jgi:nitroreductase
LIRNKIRDCCWGQEYISTCSVFLVFCADFYRVSIAFEKDGKKKEDFDKYMSNIDTLIIGSHDVGISMQNATVAAESFGLGTVDIGAIRYKSYEGLYKILNPTKGSNDIIRYFVSNAGFFVDKLIKLCNDEAYVFDNGEWKYSIQYKELLDDTTKYVEISPEVAKQYIKDYKN